MNSKKGSLDLNQSKRSDLYFRVKTNQRNKWIDKLLYSIDPKHTKSRLAKVKVRNRKKRSIIKSNIYIKTTKERDGNRRQKPPATDERCLL